MCLMLAYVQYNYYLNVCLHSSLTARIQSLEHNFATLNGTEAQVPSSLCQGGTFLTCTFSDASPLVGAQCLLSVSHHKHRQFDALCKSEGAQLALRTQVGVGFVGCDSQHTPSGAITGRFTSTNMLSFFQLTLKFLPKRLLPLLLPSLNTIPMFRASGGPYLPQTSLCLCQTPLILPKLFQPSIVSAHDTALNLHIISQHLREP